MVSSACQAITCILLVVCAAVCVRAQTTTPKVASASISGKVTIKGKPAVGVLVRAIDTNDRDSMRTKRYRATTDQTGSYRITNLAAGSYEITSHTPSLVPTNQSDSVVVAEGEEVEDVNIALVPGGVITGRITDSENEPVIGEQVNITPLDELSSRALTRTLMMRVHFNDHSTDDRGIYRAFGLPSGKYKVSVGRSDSRLGMQNAREYYKETFYPSVTEPAKATVIEVTEGSETNNVDIVLGRPVGTFTVTGRVVDGETGKPLPNVQYGLAQRIDRRDGSSEGSSTVGSAATNANGEFRYENITPGKYTIFTAPAVGSDITAASVSVEVVDRDLKDLLIKTTKGSSLSGVVVVEGPERVQTMLSALNICAQLENRESYGSTASSTVGQDGSFRINGVQSGVVRLWLCHFGDNRKAFEIVRVERDGIPQSDGFNVKGGEQIAGIRVIAKYVKLTGVIRGQVKVENGELPPVSQLWLSIWPLDENLQLKPTSSISRPELDSRGRFFIEQLPAGTYQLKASIFPQGRTRTRETTQQVIVTDDTVTEVTLIIKP